MKFIERAGIMIVRVLAGAVLAILLAGSWAATAFLDRSEHLYVLPDYCIRHLVLLAVFAALFICLKRTNCLQRVRKHMKSCRPYMLLAAMMLAAAVCIIVLQVNPVADQATVSNVAVQILNGDFSSFAEGGYMYRYPHQKGIVVILAVIYSIAGDENFLIAELCNLLAAAAICVLMFDLAPEKYRKPTLAGLILFFPMWIYTTFIYGTLPGLAFSLLSVRALKKFDCSGNFLWLILCVFSAFSAVVCKSNYLIFAIGLMILLLAEIIVKHRYAAIAAAAALLCLLCVKEDILNQAIYCLSDTHDSVVEETQGFPSLGWIVMGLSDDGSRAEGWYDGYVWNLYTDSRYDSEVVNARLREDLEERIDDFKEDPIYAVRFFLRKTLTQWCEPTFQSIWIVEVKSSDITDNPLYQFMIRYQDDGVVFRDLYIGFMNLFQSLVYLGAFLYIISYKNQRGIFSLWGMIIFFGGFLFHLFWEAKGQYTWIYFILLIPYAAEGIRMFMEGCLQRYDYFKIRKQPEEQ